MNEYSVEEVRARFEAWARGKGIRLEACPEFPGEYDYPGTQGRWECWQAAYAERIKADEGAVTYAVARKAYAALETEGDAIECMRKALLTVWPSPPAQADEGSVPPIPTEIDWTHLKAFVTLGFYDEAQCQKFIRWAQGAHPPAQADEVAVPVATVSLPPPPATPPRIIAEFRDGAIMKNITFTSEGGAELILRDHELSVAVPTDIFLGTAEFGKSPAQADEGAPAGVTDALPVAVKACDEEMQRYGHKFAGAVAWYAMRAALLAVWPTPPAPVAQGESLERCDTCDGEGEVYAAGASSREACSDCDGSGITAALAGRPHAVPDDTIRLDYLEAHVEPGIRSAVDKALAAAPSPTAEPVAQSAMQEQITDGKAQWDEVASILGANGDDVDDVIAKARAAAQKPAQAAQVDGAAALAHFTDYFVRNYPGPNTIIYDPKWHAPKIFRAAQYAIANATTTPPVAEPVAQADGMCNADNPARRCVCREEFGRRVCEPVAQGEAKKHEVPCAHSWERLYTGTGRWIWECRECFKRGGECEYASKHPEIATEAYNHGYRAALAAQPRAVPDGWTVSKSKTYDGYCVDGKNTSTIVTASNNLYYFFEALAAAPSPGESE